LLGLIDAALGLNEKALREGRRAVELLPVEKDVIRGPGDAPVIGEDAVWVGDDDLARGQLAIATQFRLASVMGKSN
jgi:hypothetical protein